MGKDEYASATGGALKLKGAGIDKKRKKKKASKPGDGEQPASTTDDGKTSAAAEDGARKDDEALDPSIGKTEAERRHEEMRRKRLDERLKREGVKTHKERVEELNKYLSTLSEHHDMPKIGPG